jgi:hypothetical protein
MKKVITTFFVLMISVASLRAQEFKSGTNIISAGVGLGSSIGSFTYGSQTPALSLQYERGVWAVGGPGVISLGGYAGFKSFKYSGNDAGYIYSEKWNYTIIGIRSAYHFNGLNADKIDVYGGIMLSYNILNYSYTDNSGYANDLGNYGSSAGFTLYVGGRYFFSDNVGAYAELGYGVSYLTLGLNLKF